MSEGPDRWKDRLANGYCACLVGVPVVGVLAFATGWEPLKFLMFAMLAVVTVVCVLGFASEWWSMLFGGPISKGAYSSARENVRGFFPWLFNRPKRK